MLGFDYVDGCVVCVLVVFVLVVLGLFGFGWGIGCLFGLCLFCALLLVRFWFALVFDLVWFLGQVGATGVFGFGVFAWFLVVGLYFDWRLCGVLLGFVARCLWRFVISFGVIRCYFWVWLVCFGCLV